MNLFYLLLICTALFFNWTLYSAFCHHTLLEVVAFLLPPLNFTHAWALIFACSFRGRVTTGLHHCQKKILVSVLFTFSFSTRVLRKVENFTVPCIPLCNLFLYLSSWSLILILRSALKSRDLKKSAHLYLQYQAGTKVLCWNSYNKSSFTEKKK